MICFFRRKMSWVSYVLIYFLLASSVLSLSSCGGGGGGDSSPSTAVPDNPTVEKNCQVLLGSLSGAFIRAYRLTNLNAPVEGPINATESFTDLEGAGKFSLNLTGVDDSEWILVIASGGYDIDADDDGVVDSTPTQNFGQIHALGRAADWRAGAQVTALSDMAWHYAQDTLSDADALQERLDLLASRVLLSEDLNQDGTVDYRDVLFFHPLQNRYQTMFPYIGILPDQDGGHETYIEAILGGSPTSSIEATLFEQFGENPWQPIEVKTVHVDQVNFDIPGNPDGITSVDLSVRSVLDDETDTSNQPTITDVGGPTVVMASDNNGDTLLLGYALPVSARVAVASRVGAAKLARAASVTSSESVEVSPRSTALALVMTSPLFLGTSGEERATIATEVLSLASFDALAQTVSQTFAADSGFLTHLDQYPEIPDAAAEIAAQGIENYIADFQSQALAQTASVATATEVVGREVNGIFTSAWQSRDPWLWYNDDRGDFWEMPFLARPVDAPKVIAAGNPALIPYAAEYFKADGTRLSNWTYVGRPSSLIQKRLQSGAAQTILDIPSQAAYVQLNKYGFTTYTDPWDHTPANIIRGVDIFLLIYQLSSLLVSLPAVDNGLKKAIKNEAFRFAVLQVGGGILNLLQTTDIGFSRLGNSSSGGSNPYEKISGNLYSIAESFIQIAIGIIFKNPGDLAKSIATSMLKISNPSGWAAIAAEASIKIVNNLGPFMGYYVFADSTHGYYIERDSRKQLVRVLRDDTPPAATQSRVLSSVSISGSTQVNENSTLQLTATASWSDGSTTDITGSASWTESSSAITSVNRGLVNAGSVSANTPATINLSYASGGVTKTTSKTITVNNLTAALSSVSISGNSQVNENSSLQLTATASWSDGTSTDITSTATWSENSGALTSVNRGLVNAGSVSANTPATINLSYASGGVTKTTSKNITVNNLTATLTGVSISGSTQVNENSSLQLTATASWSDGSTTDVTGSASWTESSTAITSVSGGLVQAGSVSSDTTASVNVSYSSGGVTKTASKSITVIDTSAGLGGYAGYYSGTFSGGYQGTWNATFDSSGNISGSVTSYQTGNFSVSGTFQPNGVFTMSGNVTGANGSAVFSGQIDSNRTVSGTWTSSLTSGTFTSGSGTNQPTPGTVISATGRVWMDRNLGASQVALSVDDAAAYGDLYQWGRGTDGHEQRTSASTTTLSSSDTPGHGSFIGITSSSSWDWRSPQNDNLWQGVTGTNNPCPSGFRLPTEAEWQAEMATWSSQDSAGAFASPLKLVSAGRRYRSGGAIYDAGSIGHYWSSSVRGSYARALDFYSGDAYTYYGNRAFGFSVRCLED